MKRSGKRLLAILLCLTMALTLLPVSALAARGGEKPETPAEAAGQVTKAAGEVKEETPGDFGVAAPMAGSIIPDGAVADTWVQVEDTKVTGSVAPAVENGKLKLTAVAGNANNCDGGTPPAFFINEQLNAAIAAAGEGERTLSFDMTPNSTSDNMCLGFGLNFTDRSHEVFIGYNTIGKWFIQYYGGNKTGTDAYPSFTGPELTKGTTYKIEIKWTDEKITVFKVNDTEYTIPNEGAFCGVPVADTVGFKCGVYNSGVTSMEISNLHYTGQAPVNVYDVSGKVSDSESGELLDGVTVTATAAGGASYTATTNGQGNYTLEELVAGDYTLTLTKNGYGSKTDTVRVTNGDVTGLNFTMTALDTISIPTDGASYDDWTQVGGKTGMDGVTEPAYEDGRLVLTSGYTNGHKISGVNPATALFTSEKLNSELAAFEAANPGATKTLSFTLTPETKHSADNNNQSGNLPDYLAFGVVINSNEASEGTFIGYSDVDPDYWLFQNYYPSSSSYVNNANVTAPTPGVPIKFEFTWSSSTLTMKINGEDVGLGTLPNTIGNMTVTSKIAFCVGGSYYEYDALQDNRQTVIRISDLHYSGQETVDARYVKGAVTCGGKAVEGATVCVEGDQTGTYTQITDEFGKYSVALPLQTEAYTLSATKDGYNAVEKTVEVTAEAQKSTLEAVNFALTELPTISGKVVDTQNNPIQGATVQSDLRGDAPAAVTDAQGKFTVIGAVDGTHTLTVSAEGYEKQDVEVTVDGESVTLTEDIVLEDRQIPAWTLQTDDMSVTVAKAFPQTIKYTLANGKTMYGQTAELDTILINGVAVKPTVTSVQDSDTKVTYTMVIDSTNNATTGVTATITAEIRVGPDGNDLNDATSAAAGRTLGFYITDVAYPNNDRLTHPVDTIEIPNHSLVSVRSTEPGAAVTGGKLANNTLDDGDTTYIANNVNDPKNYGTGDRFFAAFVYNDQLSAGLASNSAYGGGTAGSQTYPVQLKLESKDGGTAISLGLGSTLWYYDHDITANQHGDDQTLTETQLSLEKRIIAPLDMPFAKVVITEDMNGSGTVDWQDGAIAYRETVMHIPTGGESVADTVNLRISMNFGSQATNPFLIALENVKRVAAHTDGLGQFVLLKGYAGEGHDSNHPQYDNIGIRMGGPEDLLTLMTEGEALGASFGIHVNASEFYAEAITDENQPRRNRGGGGLHYGWNWLDQGIAINAVYDYASGLRKERLDALYEIVKGHPFTVYVDVWGNNTSGREDDFQTRALSNEIVSYPNWRIAHEWSYGNPYESVFQHWTTDYTYGGYGDKGKLNSNVLRFLLNQYKDSFPPDFANYGGASNAPLLGGPAMQGFEGWQQDGEYNLSIYNTFNQMVYTKFLQHYSVMEWTNAEEAVTMPYGANHHARSNSTTAQWIPETQIKLSDGTDEVVVTRGTSGKLVTDFGLDTVEKFVASETEYRSRVVTLNGKVIVTGAPASAGEDYTFPASRATLKYLIPWYWDANGKRVAENDEKLYHWNAQGGQSTWELPDGWDVDSVIVYELSDQGRDAGKTVRVIDGKVTLTATADTCYVVTKGADADNEPNIVYGVGLHLGDPSFNMDTTRTDNPWKVTGKGTAVHTTNSEGIGVLKMTGEVAISQKMTGLTPGTNYVSYVAVDNRSNAEARIEITDGDGNVVATNYTVRSIAKNYVSSYYLHNNHGVEAGGSYFQNMFVYFQAEAGKEYTMTLSRTAGVGNVYFDDLRTVEYGFDYARGDGTTFGAEQTKQEEKGKAAFPVEYDENGAVVSLYQDFENVPQGIWPFVVGPVEDVNDNRTHVSELNAPFTQAGWDVKKLDDVIDGNWSIKTNGLSGRNSLVYQTIPQNFRFEPNKVYTVSFDYELGTTGSYIAVVGDGAYTNLDNLTVYNLTQTLNLNVPNNSGVEGNTTAKATVGQIEFTVVGSTTGQTWIGIYSRDNANNQGTSGSAAAFGGYTDFVLDNLRIELAPADKNALALLLHEADAMTENNYVSAVSNVTDEAAWTAFTNARDAGQEVFDNNEATEGQVTAALEALQTAIDGLTKVEISISGTVTNAQNKPVEGVVLTLENAAYFPTGLTVTTGADGTYKFESKSGVELTPATYHIKAQATGYNVTTTAGIALAKTNPQQTKDIALEAENPGAYVNDFNNGDISMMGHLLTEEEAAEKESELPGMEWIEYNGSGALKVTWNATSGEVRHTNNVVDKTIAFANGSASYDVTALTTGIRFNVTLRASASDVRVAIGQQDQVDQWMGEFWNTDGSGYSGTTTNAIYVAPGATRNVRVVAEDTVFTVYIDGIQVYTVDSSNGFVNAYGPLGTPVTDAGYIGINARHQKGAEFIIDNIRIISADTTAGVYNVSGSVTDNSGTAVSGAAIELVNAAGERVGGTATNALGAYQVTGVEPGTYTVKVTAPFFVERDDEITVTDDDVEGKNFTLTLDKSSLTALIEEMEALNGEDYTPETWATLAEALTKAEEVADDSNATVAALNTAYRDLSNAKEALVIAEKAAADFSELRDVHKEMANKPNDNYTNGSWADFQETVEAARRMLLAGTATQDEVNNMVTALQEAFGALVKATPADEMNLEELQAAYDAAKDVENEGYTEASWAAFEAAREKALGILSNADGLTQDEVDAAATALADAQKGLKKPGGGGSGAVVTEPDPEPTTKVKENEDGTTTTTVTEPDGTVTVTTTDENGEVLAEVKVPGIIPETDKRFEDVPVGHWADKAIHQLAAIEVVNGVTDTTYSPVAPMKRGDLATVLYRLSNKPAGGELSFEDVPESKYYADGIAWAAKVGVVEGFTEEEFQPETVITREQLALMLLRYAKLLGMDTNADAEVLEAFADGSATHAWAVNGMAWCVKNGILQGRSEDTLAPTSNVTRAEVAVMIDRFLGLMK